MQIMPIDEKQLREATEKGELSSKVLVEYVLLLALGYFTISTELRHLAVGNTGAVNKTQM